jgi:hypothetical protein
LKDSIEVRSGRAVRESAPRDKEDAMREDGGCRPEALHWRCSAAWYVFLITAIPLIFIAGYRPRETK